MARTTTRAGWIMRGAGVAIAALDLATFGTRLVETAGKNKLDRELVRALKERTESTRRVIIRTPPGGRDRVKDKLSILGQTASGEHARIDALSAELTLDDVQALANDPDVLSVSTDAIVTGDAVTYDLTSVSARESMLATLGVGDSLMTGDHIGIAVIDSGLAKSKDLEGDQVDEFYDFTASRKKSKP